MEIWNQAYYLHYAFITTHIYFWIEFLPKVKGKKRLWFTYIQVVESESLKFGES